MTNYKKLAKELHKNLPDESYEDVLEWIIRRGAFDLSFYNDVYWWAEDVAEEYPRKEKDE